MSKTFLAFLVVTPLIVPAVAGAQPLSAGIKFGVPLNNAFSVQSPNPLHYVAETKRYTAGPFIELHLPAHLAIEIDALYKRYGYQATDRLSAATVSAGSWEFPVLGKYRLISGPVQPFIEGGVAFSRLTDVPQVVELNRKNNYGVVAGAGVELRLGFVRLSPEIRYNAWTRRFFDSPGGYLQSNRSQATVLVGISF